LSSAAADETRAIGTIKPSRIISITIFIVVSPLTGLPIMGGILNMPPEVRAARFSRELDRFVIEALRAVKRQGGERAFNHTARDLVISVCAILAYERGTDVVVDLFDLIERVLSDAVD
jgi:hypothetical protein